MKSAIIPDMKIGIDAFGCDHARSGSGSYLYNFVANLVPECDFELFGAEVDRYTYTSDEHVKFNSVKIAETEKAERKWHKRKCPKFCVRNGYDYVIFPAADVYLPKKFPVESVAVLNTPLSTIFKNRKRSDAKRLKKALNKIQKIAVPSQFVKTDLMLYGIDESKIAVIRVGIDHKLFFPQVIDNPEFIDAKPFAIKRPYFIYSTSLSSYEKNHIQLIKAFTLFKKETGLPHRLVIAGKEGAFAQAVQELAIESEYASDILLTGYFPQSSLPMLFSGAEASLFPAENEGIGFPVIESMACGVPVLCAESGALPETGKDVPVYFDAGNEELIAEKMKLIIEDTELAQEKAKAGLELVKEYEWKKTVEEILRFLTK